MVYGILLGSNGVDGFRWFITGTNTQSVWHGTFMSCSGDVSIKCKETMHEDSACLSPPGARTLDISTCQSGNIGSFMNHMDLDARSNVR